MCTTMLHFDAPAFSQQQLRTPKNKHTLKVKNRGAIICSESTYFLSMEIFKRTEKAFDT